MLEKFSGCKKLGGQVVDGESGSKSSNPIPEQCLKEKYIGKIYESSLADETFVGARKGSGDFSLQIAGRAVDAGCNPKEGRNAVVAAAEAIV